MPHMKPYYPISQSWYKSSKSRVNVFKQPLCHSLALWEAIEHLQSCARTWGFVSGHDSLLMCDGLGWADHSHCTNVFWFHILKLGGGSEFSLPIPQSETVILPKTRPQKSPQTRLHQRKRVIDEGAPKCPSLSHPRPEHSKANPFSLVFEVDSMDYLLLFCLHT